jgi:polyketide synthase PksJ
MDNMKLGTPVESVKVRSRSTPSKLPHEAGKNGSLAICHGGVLDESDLPPSLASALLRCAHRHGEKLIIHIGPDGAEARQTYAALWDEAVRITGGLRQRGLPAGSAIMLQCDGSANFLPAFWGAVLGGFVPVPAGVPATGDPASHAVRKFRNAWQFLEKPLVITCERLAPLVRSMLLEEPLERIACIEQLRQNEPDEAAPAGAGDDVALMMLTSGSTGMPKGVMLTHRNLLARSAGMQHLNGCRDEDVTLNWMPLDHVAGLVMSHLQDVFVGRQQVHAAPAYVLQDPLRWLELLHRYRVAITFAPNFAYGLVNDRDRDIAQQKWDLSRVRYVFNGGEPIVARTARRFLQLLAPHGLRPDAMRPAWGMSETSSGVTFSERFSLAETSDEDVLVELGLPIPGVELRIVDDQGLPMREGVTGRLQCNGDAITAGYWRNPDLTRAAFTADGWFETGDRAFLRDGRLTLTGREKDIIIVNGVNYLGHEIESAIEEIDGIATSFTAACAVRDPRDTREKSAIFFVCQVGHEHHLASIRSSVRSQVLKKVGISPDYLLCVTKDDIPKTELGKIQRSRLRERFEAGDFDGAIQAMTRDAGAPPATPLEYQLAPLWAEVLGLPQVGVDDNFFDLGGHSLLAMRLMARVGEVQQRYLPVPWIFESPTIRSLAARIEAMTDGIAQPTAGRIEPAPRDPDALYRASFAQERLWFLDQLVPASPVYNIPIALRLLGRLHVPALQRALDAIVCRHAALRTTFRAVEGQTMQIVDAPRPVGINRIELPPDAADLADLLRREARQPFDLSADLMLRATLYEADSKDHVLLIVVHHIAFDGWSKGIFLRELGSLYSAFAAADAVDTAEPPVHYADYAAWQRQWLSGPVREAHLAFWRNHLKDAAPTLDLPRDRPRPARETHQGDTIQRRLADGIDRRMETLGRLERVTPFMAWLAAVNALFYRYAGQEDIVVGTPVAGRTRAEIEPVIGFFVNTLPLRTDLSDAPSFRELIRRVGRATLAAFAHQDLPFEQIVAALHPTREPNRSALFQVMFVLQESLDNPQLAGIRSEILPLHLGTTTFDLTVTIRREHDATHVLAEYSTDLFDAGTIECMLANFDCLLTSALADPDLPINRLSLLAEAERAPLLAAWNDTVRDYPRNRCVHQLFADQAERTPDAVAVVFGEQHLTYRELNVRANQLAHYLVKRGIGPEVLVGICLERSPELIVGMLAVLKAGGAYLPSDAKTPPQRLAFMIAEGQVRLVLTQQSLRDRLEPAGVPLLCLDDGEDNVSGQSQADLQSAAGADNLACVFFTSGSTGVPKGVEIPHRAISRLLFGVDYIRFDAGLRMAQLAPISFDAATLEIWGPLLHGGRCVLFPEGAPDLAELEQGLRRHRIQTLWLTASLFNAIMDERPQTLRGVEQLLIGGEALSLPHVRRALRLLGPATKIINGYGPTECTTFACCYPIPERLSAEAASVPIGRPIGNTQAYVLDADRQPVPIGVPGELYLGGDGLARGYRNRPELTAERFIDNPFKTGTRLYRTGDQVRWRIDGTLEFLRRLDDQVKLRGFRIELGEIESVVNEHPTVAQCVVTLREDRPGDKRLVAYVVAKEGETPALAELHRHVGQHLPEYMTPSAFITLKAFPLTPSGKLDRQALPAPDQDRPILGKGFVAPRTRMEIQLAAIWAEMLGLERVGVHDNFFELGGHSLMAARVVDRVQKAACKPLALSAIFRAPTIAALARHVESDLGNAHDLLEPIRPTGDGAVILSFGNEFLHLVPPRHPLYWCKLEHIDGKRCRYSSVEDIAAHFCRQISAAALEGPYVLCGYSFGGLVAFETARQLHERDGASSLLFLLEPSHALPPAAPLNSAKERSVSKIYRHLRNLAFALRSRNPALLQAEATFYFNLVHPWIASLRRLYCNALLKCGLSLPASMRWEYFEPIYLEAIARYIRRPFPGRVILVTSEEFPAECREKWERIAEGGFALHQISSSDHFDLVKNQETIAHWADLLRQHLKSPVEPHQPVWSRAWKTCHDLWIT